GGGRFGRRPDSPGSGRRRPRIHLPQAHAGGVGMNAIRLIVRRELAAYYRSYLGYVIIAAVLLIDGLLFNAYAMGSSQKKSAEVLHDFFYFSSGTTMVASIFISMRLLAEERQTGTLPLLLSAPVTDAQIVLGK